MLTKVYLSNIQHAVIVATYCAPFAAEAVKELATL